MGCSIHGHISCILEANSKSPNDFSFIGRKPNEIFQFKWKRLMLWKSKKKLNLRFIMKESKTIKIMKGSKNRRELTQVKTIYIYIFFFAYKQTNKIDILWQRNNRHIITKEIHAKKHCFWLCCTFWASKSNRETTFKCFHIWTIYQKDKFFFLGSSKDVQKGPPEVLYKKDCS